MWVAKPVKFLSPSEESAWNGCLARLAAAGTDVPFAQTLSWARAIEAVSGKVYLVFSPDEGVGGVVFSSPDRGGAGLKFECVNGPLLAWDDAGQVARQLATFAMAVSKLEPRFSSMNLTPRWERAALSPRLARLPLAPASVAEAATLIVPVYDSEVEQRDLLHRRMRRTLARAEHEGIETAWAPLESGALEEFVPKMREFGDKIGFYVPPLSWFQGLCGSPAKSAGEGVRFWQASARAPGGKTHGPAESHLLIGGLHQGAHYLFGCETREAGASAISPASAAHWRALRECAKLGLKEYDLNGYIEHVDSGHLYAGVCRFKEQFGGRVVAYAAPCFTIA